MANELAKLFVTLGLDDKEFQTSLKNIQKQMTAVSKVMLGIGVAITGALAYAVKEAEEDRQANALLANSLQNIGVAYDDVKSSVDEMIKSQLRLTGIASETQTAALAELVRDTGDYQKALDNLPLVLDVAASKQIDVGTAAEAVGKALNGTTRSLKALFPELTNVSDKYRLLQLVQEDVNGAAEAAANPLNILKEEFNDLASSIGAALLPVVKSIVDTLVPFIEKIGQWIADNPELAKGIIIAAAALGVLALMLGTIGIMLPAIAAGMTAMLSPVGLIVMAIGLLVAGIVALIAWLKPTWSDVVQFLVDVIMFPFNMLIELMNLIPKALNAIGGAFGQDWSIPEIPKINIDIPKFAAGGVITTPTVGMIGEAGPEAVIPLDRLGGGGNGGIYINMPIAGSVRTDRDLVNFIREALLSTGKFNGSTGIV